MGFPLLDNKNVLVGPMKFSFIHSVSDSSEAESTLAVGPVKSVGKKVSFPFQKNYNRKIIELTKKP